MRYKLPKNEKRNKQIGIKVKTETRLQLDYIANAEGEKLSTHIDNVLKEYIQYYFNKNAIKWDELSPEERGEK